MSDRTEDASLYVTTSTRKRSITIATCPVSPQHFHEQAHSFGTIDNIMQVLHHHQERAHLNKTERFYIHAEYVANNHLNENHSIFPNIIFDTLLKPTAHKNHHPLPPHPDSGQNPNTSIHGTTSTQ